MNFSEFAKMLYPYLGKGAEIPGYVLRLIDLIMENPFDEVSVKEDMNDKYNPLSSVSLNLLNKIYNGERKISRKKASVISSHFTREKLIDAINGLPIDAQTQLCVSLRKKGIEAEENTVDECCADLVGKILQELTFGVKEVKTASEPNIIGIDAKLKGIPATTVYVQDGKVHIDGTTISLPKQLQPPADIAPQELPFIVQLLCAYADALKRDSISCDEVDMLPRRYRTDLADQRKAYYSADSVYHSVREVFEDGESMFQDLKDDAYEGIKPTFLKDYDNGYARLVAVLEKITSTTLDKSDLSKIRGLISNLEKKGICHILVNDGKIESWVINDEIV